MRFADQAYLPRCMLYTSVGATHGTHEPHAKAIAKSCNYYFYEIGYLTGIDKIDEVGKAMGLGEETGIELPRRRAPRQPRDKGQNHEGSKGYWYGTDTVQASIGQSENRYTPLQLCVYCSTLANRGTRYKATLLSRASCPRTMSSCCIKTSRRSSASWRSATRPTTPTPPVCT